MNKEKIMGLVKSISDESGRGALGMSQDPELKKKLFKELEYELNSKSVMPSFFNGWLTKLREDITWTNYAILNKLASIYFDDMFHSNDEVKIYYWLINKNDKKDVKKYQLCVNAIVSGYEVSTNE